MPKGYWLTTY